MPTDHPMKLRGNRRLRVALIAAALVMGSLLLSAKTAAASSPYVCSGTLGSPGVLTGTHAWVNVEGFCVVNGGNAVVTADLTLEPNSVLAAAFANNDVAGEGTSSLSVSRDIIVEQGATLLLGCDPESFSCLDNGSSSSHDTVGGSVIVHSALGVIVHNTSIGGSVYQNDGGGGVSCNPQGIFALFGSGPYSAYEDSTVGGSINVHGLNTCWFGINRVSVGGSVNFDDNQLADPDGAELNTNTIHGNLSCHGNSFVWDSSEASFGQSGLYPRTPKPNTVTGTRYGQCVLASPATQGGPSGPGAF
jgi:hypothetical protein